jgi:hypothetical protein
MHKAVKHMLVTLRGLGNWQYILQTRLIPSK